MNKTASAPSRLVATIRWMARIIGALFMAVFLIFFVADCVKKGKIAVEIEHIPMTVFLLVTFVGLSIGWKWEGIGGTLALVGLLGFNILAPALVREAGTLVVTVMYGLPALLFLLYWWQTRT